MPEQLRLDHLHLQSKSQRSQPYEDGPSSVRRVIIQCEHMGINRKSTSKRINVRNEF